MSSKELHGVKEGQGSIICMYSEASSIQVHRDVGNGGQGSMICLYSEASSIQVHREVGNGYNYCQSLQFCRRVISLGRGPDLIRT